MEALKAKRVDSSDEEEPKMKKAKAKESNNGGLKGEAMGGSESELCTSVLHFYINNGEERRRMGNLFAKSVEPFTLRQFSREKFLVGEKF